MNKVTVPFHPLCLMIPAMSADEYIDLRNHIAGSGLLEPIVLFDGMILDGRHRYQACLDLDIEPVFVQYDHPDSPVDYVIGKNLDRRNLTPSQRAMTFATLCTWRSVDNQPIVVDQENNTENRINTGVSEAPHGALTLANAAQKAQVSERTMDRAVAVNKKGDNTLKELVLNGELGLTDAATVVSILPNKSDQKRAVKAAKKNKTKIIDEAIKVQEVPKEKSAYATLEQWAAMSEKEREEFISKPAKKSTFNGQKNAAIEWAEWSWNPVTGCKHDCPYCYARDIAIDLYDQGFEPSFWPSRLSAPANTKPRQGPAGRNVFANSMSDLYGRWVPKQWIDLVLQTMRDNDQWNFLMLTKFPKRAAEFQYSSNCWIGTSVDLQVRVKAAEDAFEKIDCGVKWLSIEPMIEPIKFSRPELFNWVVIGGASKSSQTPEWVPPFEWIVRVASQFLEHGAKIYLKENGRPKEFPGVITPQNAGDVFHYLKQEKVA